MADATGDVASERSKDTTDVNVCAESKRLSKRPAQSSRVAPWSVIVGSDVEARTHSLVLGAKREELRVHYAGLSTALGHVFGPRVE